MAPLTSEAQKSDSLPPAGLVEYILRAAIPANRKQSQIEAWGAGWPDLGHKNTGHPVKSEFQIKRMLLVLSLLMFKYVPSLLQYRTY